MRKSATSASLRRRLPERGAAMATTTRFDRHPRARLVEERTPIQRLHRLEAALGAVLNGSRLFVKRDDLAGFGGGSKVRKLDFLLGEARAAGADTIIATGLRQSNSARAAAAAAARLGLRVELGLRPLTGDDAGEYLDGGNALLDELYGATVRDV